MKQKLNLILASIKFNLQKQTAYSGNNFVSLLSTMVFTFSIIFFYKVIFGNVTQIVGYSYDEALFILFIVQVTYFLCWATYLGALHDLITDVNSGSFDLVLVKPVPAMFFTLTKKINLLSFFLEGFPTLLVLSLFINWSNLQITPLSFLFGVIVWISGMISLSAVYIICTLPVFWLGESESILNLMIHIASEGGTTIPFEGLNRQMKIFFGVILPVMIPTVFSVSVFLNKSNLYMLGIGSVLVAFLFWQIRKIVWNLALKNYSSASS